MNDSLYELRDCICIVYLYDILIFGRTKLNPKKCVFVKTEVRYLGQLISEYGFGPDVENTVALNACETPP